MLEETTFQDFLTFAGLDPKPHQEQAVKWMLEREKNSWMNVHGGIIADEMGLGKTIMMIGTILANVTSRTLIVLPLALLEQWRREIERTTGIRALVYHGAMKKQTPFEILSSSPVVLVTYGEVQISTDEFSMKPLSPIHKIQWGRVVFDEAHHMRNMQTNKFKGCLSLKAHIRWMLTGTPIQNYKTDLFALCHVLGFDDSFYATQADIIVEKCMLRRTKESVGIKISKLHQKSINVSWNSQFEENLANDIHNGISGIDKGTLGFVDGLCAENSNSKGWKLLLMLRAKQMCIYPKMLQHKFNQYRNAGFIAPRDEKEKDEVWGSSKLDAVSSLLIERKNNDNRKIVFCHFHKEIDEIEKRCLGAGMTVKKIDGRLASREKSQAMIAPWPEVMILQINTCCEGLNLQDFNEIYFASPHWNPAVEDQAIARCHRIGQKKDVYVFRFNMISLNDSCNSQDNYCVEVQERKRKLYVY
jgi:SNF2 family DNA or RNA helicase